MKGLSVIVVIGWLIVIILFVRVCVMIMIGGV